jgi:hypothetical protein
MNGQHTTQASQQRAASPAIAPGLTHDMHSRPLRPGTASGEELSRISQDSAIPTARSLTSTPLWWPTATPGHFYFGIRKSPILSCESQLAPGCRRGCGQMHAKVLLPCSLRMKEGWSVLLLPLPICWDVSRMCWWTIASTCFASAWFGKTYMQLQLAGHFHRKERCLVCHTCCSCGTL